MTFGTLRPVLKLSELETPRSVLPFRPERRSLTGRGQL
jgi:hypothetical protein